MDGQAKQIAETDVNEIRKLIEEVSEYTTGIQNKAWELHDDVKPQDAPDAPLPQAIGGEFIRRLTRIRDTLSDSFTTLKRFC